MQALNVATLVTFLALTPIVEIGLPQRIDVDCKIDGALERALAKAEQFDEVDIYVHGVCQGNFLIGADGVTLRAASAGSGLAAPAGNPTQLPVLEVLDAKASLRGLIVTGAEAGVLVSGLVSGWHSEVLLYEVEVHTQDGVGVLASRGARVRVLDSTLTEGGAGIVAETHAEINLQNVVVSHQEVGVIVFDDSFAALNDTTIENNRGAGVNAGDHSDVNILGGVFRENGEIHINANDGSSIRLLFEVTIGSETDSTPYALGAARDATIASYSTPVIYGDASALIGASIRFGNTVLEGNLSVLEFAWAHVRNAEITGSVFCSDGSDAICRQTTTGGVIDCPSASCGSTPTEALDREPAAPEIPVIEIPRFERSARSSVRQTTRPGSSKAVHRE